MCFLGWGGAGCHRASFIGDIIQIDRPRQQERIKIYVDLEQEIP